MASEFFDVYHDDAGQPVATNVARTCVHGDTLDALDDQLQLRREALARPILDHRPGARRAQGMVRRESRLPATCSR